MNHLSPDTDTHFESPRSNSSFSSVARADSDFALATGSPPSPQPGLHIPKSLPNQNSRSVSHRMAWPPGILLMNKPSGCTSHDVVHRVRRILGTKEIGHSGTLDPMAQGLLILLIGECTKISSYLLEKNKTYRARVLLGWTTDTLDMTGTRTHQAPPEVLEKLALAPEEIRLAALSLQGEFEMEIPIFSAVKVQGQPLYQYAREQRPVNLPHRRMRFERVDVLHMTPQRDPEGTLTGIELGVDIHCSKGSFIRSWASHLGKILGCGGALNGLCRLRSEPYSLEEAMSLEELEAFHLNYKVEAPLPLSFIPLSEVLRGSPFQIIRAHPHEEFMIQNGQIANTLRSRMISLFRPRLSSDSSDLKRLESNIDSNADVNVGSGSDSNSKPYLAEGFQVLSLKTGKLLALVVLDPDRGFVIRRGFRY